MASLDATKRDARGRPTRDTKWRELYRDLNGRSRSKTFARKVEGERFLDAAGRWRGARCVAAAFDLAQWNPVITNWSGFGVYRLRFEDTYTSYCTPLMNFPVAGVGILVEGAEGRGLVFQMTLMSTGLYNEPAGAYLPSILY